MTIGAVLLVAVSAVMLAGWLFVGGSERDRPSQGSREDSTNDWDDSGGHFTDSVERIKQLKREGRNEEAAALLLEAIEATEQESRDKGWGVAPWYYWHLAIVYRKMGEDEKELEILERFARQEHALGARVPKLLDRLEKVRDRVRDEEREDTC